MSTHLTLRAALVSLITAAACSDSAERPSDASTGERGQQDSGSGYEQLSATADATTEDAAATEDAGADRDAAQTATAFEPVWKPTSVRLELSSFGYHTGSLGYDIRRELMSAKQLEMLGGLREIPTPSGPVGADFTSYSIRITDQSGEVIAFRAAERNIVDGDEGRPDGKRTLDYATLEPFLSTFDCLSAKEAGMVTGSEPPGDLWTGAATFNTDPGCVHGVFVSPDASHSYRKWKIDEPATYRLFVSRCFQDMRLHLYDATGTNELAISEFTTAPACPELVYTFDAAGEYRIDLEKRMSAGAPHDTAGDAQLRVGRQ